MTALDIAVAIVLLFFLIRGAMRDAGSQLYSLTGLCLSLLIASQSFSWLIRHLPVANSPGFAKSIWAFPIVFLVLTFIMGLLIWLFQALLNRFHPNLAERLISASIGLVKGVLIGSLILLVVMVAYPNHRMIWNSRLAPYYLPAVGKLSRLFPPQFRFNYEEKLKELKLKRSLGKQPAPKVRI